MTSLMLFQITSLMVMLYSIKIKMYKNNVVGFMTILIVFLSIVLAYFNVQFYEDVHYLLISLLLIFIAIYHTYKVWKRSCKNSCDIDALEGIEC